MPTTKTIEYKGRNLGGLRVYGPEDWRNEKRPATERDLRLINATSAADAVYEILKREPLKVSEDEPDKPWLIVVLREVALAAASSHDGKMQEQVLQLYVSRHGMDQILEIWGADLVRLKEEIGRMSGAEDEGGKV